MSIKLVKSVNFGSSRGGLGGVGFTLIDGDGTTSESRSTTGVHEVGTSTGIYAAQITFGTSFSGSILWDTGQSTPIYAAEQYNPTAEHVEFIKNIEGGKWSIDSTSKQMVFFKSDNATEVARFGLSGSDGAASVTSVFTRNRE
jgi:hypothetical protein|tara:strand:+ start:1926 stop:2354 length:429 start_codon:yes stop_codon:yes gene_type:complete